MIAITVDPKKVHEVITEIMECEFERYDNSTEGFEDSMDYYERSQTYGCLATLLDLGILTESESLNYRSTFCEKIDEITSSNWTAIDKLL